MKAFVISAVLFVICNTMGGAQAPRTGPTPAQKAQLFQRNYPLIEKLVDNSLKLTKQTDPLSRSENYRGTILELEQQIKTAVSDGDASRVAELTTHLRSLLNRGLLPNLGVAREKTSPGHPNEERLFQVRDMTERLSVELQKGIQESRIANTVEAKQLMEFLEETKSGLDKKMEVKKKSGE